MDSSRSSTLPALLAGLPEVRVALAADLRGQLLEATVGGEEAARRALGTAAALAGLAEAGLACGLSRLDSLQVRGPKGASLAAIRPEAFALVEVDPSQRSGPVEKALAGWTPAARPPPLPAPRPTPVPQGAAAPRPAATPTPTPVPPAAPAGNHPLLSRRAPAGRPAPVDELWAGLRRALVRGHLTEAAARQRALAAAGAAPGERPGSEPVPAADLDAAVQLLTEGIGSVMAGDTLGGGRSLQPLTAPAQPNLSLRWLALHWSAKAALGSDGLAAARQQVKESLALARQLDVEARAASQLVAAELLARAGDHEKALTWLAESRSRFDRVGDRWGLGQAWLAEARILAAAERDGEGDGEGPCAEAARRACDADPSWDGPPIFLAGRALMRGDLGGAEGILAAARTPAADRVRKLIDAVREGIVSQAGAAAFLRLHHAPPTALVIRALERVAAAAPRFLQAQEALAWMHLKLGRYGEACDIFTALMAQPLAPADRSLVMLGLSCTANARRAEARPEPAAPAAAAGPGQPVIKPTDSALLPRNVQVGGMDAVFSGRLSIFSLPDLVEFLRSARRTGLLVLSSGTAMASVRFRDGWIAGASFAGAPGVGELLIRDGKLQARALEAVPADPFAEQPDLALGEQLVRRGLVEAAAVQAALRQLIELTLRRLLAWQDGEFAFTRESPPDSAIPVQVDAQGLLLHLFKEADEASRDAASAGVHA